MRKTKKRINEARALAAAITTARQSPGAARREQRSGRFDRQRGWRLAAGDRRIFMRPAAPAPARLRTAILLDASGSMHYRAELTAQMARDLAEATLLLPNVHAEVWAHTSYGDGSHEPGTIHEWVFVPKLWEKGQPTSDVDEYLAISMSGNLDGFAIAYVGDTLLEEHKSSEAMLLIVVSDGAPTGAYAVSYARAQCERLREAGMGVVSISVADDLNRETQRAMYGEGNYVMYNPNMSVIARGLANAIGRAW